MSEVIYVFCEFLEQWIHHVLCVRKVYPEVFFERVNRGVITFWFCKNPKLKNYISELVDTIKISIENGEVSMISLVIHRNNLIFEKFELSYNMKATKYDPYQISKVFGEILNKIETVKPHREENLSFHVLTHFKHRPTNLSNWELIDGNSSSKSIIQTLWSHDLFEIKLVHEKLLQKSILIIKNTKSQLNSEKNDEKL
jgi:hypothetical protein